MLLALRQTFTERTAVGHSPRSVLICPIAAAILTSDSSPSQMVGTRNSHSTEFLHFFLHICDVTALRLARTTPATACGRIARGGSMASDVGELLLRLAAAGLIGACIGFERRMHHKAIGIGQRELYAASAASVRDRSEFRQSDASRFSVWHWFPGRSRDLQERLRRQGDQGCRRRVDHWCDRPRLRDILLVARTDRRSSDPLDHVRSRQLPRSSKGAEAGTYQHGSAESVNKTPTAQGVTNDVVIDRGSQHGDHGARYR
jgi:hypothetical protein